MARLVTVGQALSPSVCQTAASPKFRATLYRSQRSISKQILRQLRTKRDKQANKHEEGPGKHALPTC